MDYHNKYRIPPGVYLDHLHNKLYSLTHITEDPDLINLTPEDRVDVWGSKTPPQIERQAKIALILRSVENGDARVIPFRVFNQEYKGSSRFQLQ
jgi:hypothetical protein